MCRPFSSLWMTVQSEANAAKQGSSHDKLEENMGSFEGTWFQNWNEMQQKREVITSDKELERQFEEEELKCTKTFVLVRRTMTTCTRSSRKKQAQIWDRRMEKFERALERCKQIPRSFEQKTMALQFFATPALTFNSGLTLHTETTLTRLDRKVHAMLFKSTRWRSQVDVYIADKRTFGPSRSNREML